jgi:FAD/FMN-containing dehydrogenase
MSAQVEQDDRGTSIQPAAFESFRASFRGELVLPSDAPYELARRVWNGAIDKRPALIARCSGAVDVVRAVEFAREHDLLVAVRGGGHNVAGHATCDGGVVIDLSPMRSNSLDLARRSIRVQAGATWGDVDHETQAFGLATTGGLVSTTGIAGFTLGGGFGWLMRKHGLACDNLLSAEIVTAGGRLLRTSADENADLFWGLRGGGGNFGIVTSFEFRLHAVGPIVTAGAIFFRGDDAAHALRFYRDWIEKAPDELTTAVTLATAAPAPFLPEEVHGKRVVVVSGCFDGEPEDGMRALQPLKQFDSAVADLIEPMPYTEMQALVDGQWAAGACNYFKSSYLAGLEDRAIETLLDAHERAVSPDSKIQLYHLGGAAARVGADETAFPHREAPYLMNIAARWTDPAESDIHVSWARELHAAMTSFATGGVYVNFLGEEGQDRVRAAYGERTYERLVELKNSYDPANVFRVNQNIPPAPATTRPSRRA